jgi:ABC-type Zn uptake system ZnuABC Zn-binding protein ZnuA
MSNLSSNPLLKKAASLCLLSFILFFLSPCVPAPAPSYNPGTTKIKVLAAETFLADITRSIAGDRAEVISLIPMGLDPHSFESTPQDLALIGGSDVFIINGSGFESWLGPVMNNLPSDLRIIEASKGLTPRQPSDLEIVDEEIDPHFWLDPTRVIYYVGNIRDGLIAADPAGDSIYTNNAAAYVNQLQALDAWVASQIETIPADRRTMVTNHESFGYYADRYGLKIVGTILPGVTTGVSPSAHQLADLVTLINNEKVPAIFLEAGSNPELADQLASETDVKVITNIYSHSVTEADGPAPTYIAMIRANTEAIVKALKE